MKPSEIRQKGTYEIVGKWKDLKTGKEITRKSVNGYIRHGRIEARYNKPAAGWEADESLGGNDTAGRSALAILPDQAGF